MLKKLLIISGLLFTSAGYSADWFAERTVTVKPSEGECVGNTADPLCVFDTVIACAIRAKADLCKSVGIKYDEFFKSAFNEMKGQDYKFRLADLVINRRKALCTYANEKACVLHPDTGEVHLVDMSMTDLNNVAVYLKRQKDGKWSVIFATKYSCWSDEDCT